MRHSPLTNALLDLAKDGKTPEEAAARTGTSVRNARRIYSMFGKYYESPSFLKQEARKARPPGKRAERGPWAIAGVLDQLTALWKDGISSGLIAARLSDMTRLKITRNAVIGKIERTGLADKYPHPNNWKARAKAGKSLPNTPKTKRIGLPKWERKRLEIVPRHVSVAEPKPTPYVIRTDIPPVIPRKQLIDLADDECRFPVGDVGEPGFGFCAQSPRIPGKPYCETCCQRAYNGIPVRARDRVKEFEPA